MHEIDVVGIGNAIVDVLCQADDRFLDRHGLTKGAMMLVDAEQAGRLYAAMPPGVEISGGSAANTMAGIASLGGTGAFIGKVRDDQLGEVFAHDIRSIGISFMTPPALEGPPTGRCLIMVTPDGQRTMNTLLGAANDLTPDDVNPAVIGAAKVTYLEGYLWDPPAAKDAFRKALDIAHGAGRKVALTLSDSFCVDRHRDEFRALVDQVDIVFANEAEILSLYQVGTFDEALHAVRRAGTLAVLTRSEQGSVILDGGDVHVIGAERGVTVIDTTGAGDLYAAGFLSGLTRGRPLAECGRMGAIAAAEAISHMGARPQADLAALVAGKLG